MLEIVLHCLPQEIKAHANNHLVQLSSERLLCLQFCKCTALALHKILQALSRDTVQTCCCDQQTQVLRIDNSVM
jgi:hypothetical protein